MTYALQALVQLAIRQATTPVACHELAHDGQMPERFLLQILRLLVNAGLLVSTRGPEGGYALAREPGDITVVDLFEAFDNPLVPSVPPLPGLSDESRQRLLAALGRAMAVAQVELAKVSLADLIAEESSDRAVIEPV